MNSKLRDILEKLYDNATVAHKTIGINNAKSVDVPGAEKAILALFESYAAEREQQARNNEAGNIYKIGMDIVVKRPASAVVAGGTDLDKFLNELERKYGKDLIQWVYGDHNTGRTLWIVR